MIVHPIPPLFDENSKTLILGSFPSVKSRESAFFYGHKQNRFWQVVANIFGEKIPQNIEEKKQLILANKIALWDVIGKCEIEGSADSTIKNVTANDLTIILNNAPIERIFVNGKTALKYYDKYIKQTTSSYSYQPERAGSFVVSIINSFISSFGIILRDR